MSTSTTIPIVLKRRNGTKISHQWLIFWSVLPCARLPVKSYNNIIRLQPQEKEPAMVVTETPTRPKKRNNLTLWDRHKRKNKRAGSLQE
jgi:hypothetical protein